MLALLVTAGCTTPAPNPDTDLQLRKGGWQNRYLRYGDEFDYLVGFDLQQLHADVGIDYRKKIDFLHAHGINKIRIWLYASWFGLPGDKHYPEGGKILYPWRVDTASNKFDLDSWDAAFWDRTREVISYARSKRIIVEVSLFTIQEPRNYFRQRNISYAFKNTDNLQAFGSSTDRNGAFMNGFFALGYTDNGRSLLAYQKALIDKALVELEEFGNVYFELINESPGTRDWIERDLPHVWTKYWLRYLDERTDKLLATHSTGFMSLEDGNKEKWTRDDFAAVGSRYWEEDYVDGFNFHLYADDPQLISDALNVYQTYGLTLICNEGGSFYTLDRSSGYPNFHAELDLDELHNEIRHAWGMMTSGGYFSMYYGPVPNLGDAASREAAKAMHAMRHVVEKTPFEQLRPIRDDGTELDDIVRSGPGTGWQVIADVGRHYIVYFWGPVTANAVDISMAPGVYSYSWFDTREIRPPLTSGEFSSPPSGRALIDGPNPGSWAAGAGTVLVISVQQPAVTATHTLPDKRL
jgi:hypothetical protein